MTLVVLHSCGLLYSSVVARSLYPSPNCRTFRIMDDDGSRSLDFQEFRKGIHDYGIDLDNQVSENSGRCALESRVMTIFMRFAGHTYQYAIA